MTPTNSRPNPYVGPRAFRAGETLYGRDREIRDLLDLLVAERIVLLHSPSGAGKSSLVQAGLMPRLQEDRFLVLPVVRVNQEPPEGLPAQAGFNRYLFSALVSLEEAVPEEQRLPLEELAGLTLSAYLDKHRAATANTQPDSDEPKTDSEVLIFDQFEEILTVAPTDQEGKLAFFEQVGVALRNRSRWALFSMREDYLAALSPYLRPIPTRLENTFRLDLLTAEAARPAIQNPPSKVGVTFQEAAAQKLIIDLRMIHVQNPDGSMEEQPGPYVEPVQLQVVCFRLWQNLAPDDVEISLEDVAKVGDVGKSLAEYYAERVAEIASRSETKERLVRAWFDEALITENGIRSQVLMQPDASSGLPNQTIRMLQDSHLVRSEKRRGTTWFELTHDRLIRPIRQNNAEWFQANLSLLQRQAALWQKENRSDHLLLRDDSLSDAETWAAENTSEITPAEQDFLRTCQEAGQRAQEERMRQEQAIKLQEQARSARRLRLLLLLASLAAVAALIFAASAIFSSQRAAALAVERDQQAGTAQANAGTAQANAGIALAAGEQAIVERSTAVAASTQADLERARAEAARSTAEAASREALAQKAIAEAQSRLASSRQLAALAQGYLDSDLSLAALLGIEAYRITDTLEAKSALLSSLQASLNTTLQELGHPIPKEKDDVISVAVSPDGVHMAWATQEGSLVVWDYQTQTLVRRLEGHLGAVEALAYSPDGSRLASGGDDYRLFLWEVGSWERTQLVGAVNSVKSLVFSPDGRRLAGAVGTVVTIWDLDSGQIVQSMERQIDFIRSLAWSPMGDLLASGGEDGRIIAWSTDTGEAILRFPRQVGAIYGLDWSPDGNFLASAGESGALTVWDKNTGRAAAAPILAHQRRPVFDVAYSPDGRLLASGGGDNSVSFFDAHTLKLVERLENYHINSIRSLAFRPTLGRVLLATASLDDTVGLHIVNLQQPLNEVLTSDKGEIFGLANGSQSELLVAAWDSTPTSVGEPRPITVWELRQRQETPLLKLPAETIQAALSPDGKKLAIEAPDGVIRVLELPSGQESRSIQSGAYVYQNLAFSSDGNYLAASLCPEENTDRSGKNLICGLNTFDMFDIRADPAQRTNLLVWSLGAPNVYLRALAMREASGGYSYLAMGGDSSEEILLLQLLEGYSGLPPVSYLLYSPDLGGVSSLALSPDGSRLASGHSNNLLVLWDLASFQQIGQPLFGAQAEITSLVFSQHGTALISGGTDGQVLRWDISPQSWIERSCKLAGRNMTSSEWEQLFPGIPIHKTCPEY